MSRRPASGLLSPKGVLLALLAVFIMCITVALALEGAAPTDALFSERVR